jgi:hypothetical protein
MPPPPSLPSDRSSLHKQHTHRQCLEGELPRPPMQHLSYFHSSGCCRSLSTTGALRAAHETLVPAAITHLRLGPYQATISACAVSRSRPPLVHLPVPCSIFYRHARILLGGEESSLHHPAEPHGLYQWLAPAVACRGKGGFGRRWLRFVSLPVSPGREQHTIGTLHGRTSVYRLQTQHLFSCSDWHVLRINLIQ